MKIKQVIADLNLQSFQLLNIKIIDLENTMNKIDGND